MREMQVVTVSGGNERGDARRAGFALTSVLLAFALLLAGAGEARAAMYKWVDEKGVVHYTDKMPPEAVDKASVELNKQGVQIKKTDKALTPEQRQALEQEAGRKREVARAQEEIARRDRALVSSYTSEAEIDLARNRSLQTINNVILSAQAFSEQLNKRKVDVEAKKAESEGKPVVAVLDRELESIDLELARQADVIAQKQRETTAITAKYDADKQRWRELVAAKSATKAAATVNTGATAVVPAKGSTKTAATVSVDGTAGIPVAGAAKK
jgi:Domain of unknown function (DUF4124)